MTTTPRKRTAAAAAQEPTTAPIAPPEDAPAAPMDEPAADVDADASASAEPEAAARQPIAGPEAGMVRLFAPATLAALTLSDGVERLVATGWLDVPAALVDEAKGFGCADAR